VGLIEIASPYKPGTTPLSPFPPMSFLVMALRFEIWRHQTIPVVSRIVESKVKIDLEEVNTRRGACVSSPEK
jgi:hypothetical protein